MSLFLDTLALVATVLGSSMALPQTRRLARTGRIEGVSTAWAGVSVSINSWWIAYALAAEVWLLLPVSVVSVALYTTISVLLVRASGRAGVPGLLVGLFGLGMLPLPFLLFGGWALAGVVVGLCYGVQLLPAVIAACRTRDLAGVSSTTWLIAWAEALLWLGYGLGVADVALVAAGAVGTAMATVILVRLAVTGHRPLQVVTLRPLAASR